MEVTSSYSQGEWTKTLMEQLTIDPDSRSGFTLKNGLLRYKERLVIEEEESLKRRVLKALHDSFVDGHSREVNTYNKVKQLFCWPGLKKAVKDYVKACDICSRCKHENIHPPELLQPLPIPDQAWTNISMHFMEGLLKSEGRDCVPVVVDRLMKYAHFLSLSRPFTAQEVARVFLDQVGKLHGLPQVIVSDRDKVFTSLLWKELMKSLGTQLHMSSSYHLETNG